MAAGLVVDACTQHVGLKPGVGISARSIGQCVVHIVESMNVLVVAVILVGALIPGHIVLWILLELCVIYLEDGKCYGIVYDSPGLCGCQGSRSYDDCAY